MNDPIPCACGNRRCEGSAQVDPDDRALWLTQQDPGGPGTVIASWHYDAATLPELIQQLQAALARIEAERND